LLVSGFWLLGAGVDHYWVSGFLWLSIDHCRLGQDASTDGSVWRKAILIAV
jgi:hypothetical protein